MRKIFGALVVIGFAAGCGSASKKSCETHSTGTLQVMNGYATQFTVAIDGVDFGVVNPGTTGSGDVPAGSHTMSLTFVGGGAACADTSIVVEQCAAVAYHCP